MAWIHWDPNPVLFVIPWIQKPVVWYGLFFALGFYLAYLLMRFLTERYLYGTSRFAVSDVKDWDFFREMICHNRDGYIIFSELSSSTKNALLNGKIWTGEMKREVIGALNKTFDEGELRVTGVNSREENLAKVFGENGKKTVHRLSLEHQYQGVFYTFRERAKKLADGLFTYVFLGTLIGARLGHLLFYRDPQEYLMNPYQLIAVWEGGLASHGAVIGIVCGLLLFSHQSKEYGLLRLIDLIAAPVALCAVCIRIGNFFNQEILGIPTTVPWAIVFGHPMDGSASVPRHPVQLYEAVSYFVVLCVLLLGWRIGWSARKGRLAGMFFLTVFGARFLLEFFKETLGVWDGLFPLMTGQVLSIPIIVIGALLLVWKGKKRQHVL